MRLSSACLGCFASVSCLTRIEIVNLLKKKKKMAVLEIAKHFKVTQPTVTHHLKYLEEAKVLKSEKEGRQVFYYLHPKCDENACKIFH